MSAPFTWSVGLPTSAADNTGRSWSAVISDVVWDRVFDCAPDVVGKTINVNDVTISIVGVAPKRFAGARVGGSQMRVWLPLNARTSAGAAHGRDGVGKQLRLVIVFSLAARLRAGVTRLEQTEPTSAGDRCARGTAHDARSAGARAAQSRQRSCCCSPTIITHRRVSGGNPCESRHEPADSAADPAHSLHECEWTAGWSCDQAAARNRGSSFAGGRASPHYLTAWLPRVSCSLSAAAGLLGLGVILVLMRTLLGTRLPTIQLALHWLGHRIHVRGWRLSPAFCSGSRRRCMPRASASPMCLRTRRTR